MLFRDIYSLYAVMDFKRLYLYFQCLKTEVNSGLWNLSYLHEVLWNHYYLNHLDELLHRFLSGFFDFALVLCLGNFFSVRISPPAATAQCENVPAQKPNQRTGALASGVSAHTGCLRQEEKGGTQEKLQTAWWWREWCYFWQNYTS